MSAAVDIKGRGYVSRNKVRIEQRTPEIVAEVDARTGLWRVTCDDRGVWRCTCPCRRPWCSHISATKVIVSVPAAPPMPSSLTTIDVCAETMKIFEQRWRERERREAAHRARIERTGSWLGSEVGSYRLTLADAQGRLEQLLDVMDPELVDLVDVRLVPYSEAKAIAESAFASGVANAQKAGAA